MKDLHRLSSTSLRDAFLRGDYKAVDIAAYFLDRIRKHNPSLGAFLEVLEVRAMEKAELLDHKKKNDKPLGKLACIPIAIKDNTHIEREITTCGSLFLKNYRAPFSASALHFLEEEDALIVGKTNLDEFSMGSSNEHSAFFPTQNPWNPKCVPGGSSGGSAAAVAARLSFMATGSDTGGSIRQPASFCGIVGFKPTYGRVSRHGLVAFGSSLDQIGPFGVNVRDIASMMEVIGRYCERDANSLDLPAESYPLSPNLEEGIVVGVPWHFLENLSSEAKANFEQSIEVMKNLGAKILEIDLDILKYSIAVYYIIATAEASTNLARFDGIRYGIRPKDAKTIEEVYAISREEGFGPEVKKRIMLGTYVLSAGFQNAFYKKAQKVRTLIIDAFEKAFEMCDLVMMPVTPSSAFAKDAFLDPLEMYLQDIFTVPANLAGVPAISIPSGFSSSKMPMGVQMIGPQMCDTSLIQYAYAFEQATCYEKIPEGYA